MGEEKIGSIIYIRYLDHVLFRNSDPNFFEPAIREATGWVIKDDDKALLLVFDKSVNHLPYEKAPIASGLVVLKDDILEIRKIG